MTVSRPADFETLVTQYIAAASPELARELLSIFIHTLMGADADATCRAAYGQHARHTANSRNGYRRRDFHSQSGLIELAIPKLRYGRYYPGWILRGSAQAECELISAATMCYLLGVSRNRVQKLVENLGISSLSTVQLSFLTAQLNHALQELHTRPLNAGPYPFVAADALAIRAHRDGRVVEMQLLIATGVNAEGQREILGTQLHSVADGDRWLTFFRDLTARGLSGVALVTGNFDAQLLAAIDITLPTASWHRCATHYAIDLMAITPKSSRSRVHSLLGSIFEQRDVDSVAAQYDRVLHLLTGALPGVAEHLKAARGDLLVYTELPHQLWQQIWSNNLCALRMRTFNAVNAS